MRGVAGLLAMEIALAIAARARRITRAVLRLEALHRRPGCNLRPVDREMLVRQQPTQLRMLHELPLRADGIERLQQERPQQSLRRDRRPAAVRVRPGKIAVERRQHLVHDRPHQPQRVFGWDALLKVNIGKQFTRPLVQTPHRCLRQPTHTTNHIRSSLSGGFFSSLLETGKFSTAFLEAWRGKSTSSTAPRLGEGWREARSKLWYLTGLAPTRVLWTSGDGAIKSPRRASPSATVRRRCNPAGPGARATGFELSRRSPVALVCQLLRRTRPSAGLRRSRRAIGAASSKRRPPRHRRCNSCLPEQRFEAAVRIQLQAPHSRHVRSVRHRSLPPTAPHDLPNLGSPPNR